MGYVSGPRPISCREITSLPALPWTLRKGLESMSHFRRSLLAAVTTALALSVLLPAAAAAADHLLLGEVVMKVREPRTTYGSEYVEIVNPTAAPIDLSDVYLTDATFTGQGYWQIVEGGGAGLGGSGGDFHARFPAGLILAAGESLVIALEGSELFETAYGELPDLELYEEDSAADDVPEMREAFPGSIGIGLGSTGGNAPLSDGWLGDTGESLVLYAWNGVEDLVQDLDYLTWGTGSIRVTKTGVSVDGPDADATPSAYLPDTATGSQASVAVHTFGKALLRTDAEETGETLTGGNGLTGHDETSEPMAATWSNAADQDPSLLGAGLAPAPILLSVAPTAAVIYAGVPASVAVSLDAADTPLAPVLHWSVDGGAWNDVTASGSGGAWSAGVPAQAAGAVVSWWLEAAGSGGGSTTYPANAPFYTESYTVQTAPDPGEGPAHLLLTEVCVSGTDQEFIEIHNPTDATVALDDYYLTDACYISGGTVQGYWNLPAGNPSTASVGGGDFVDFHGRFPAGAEIAAGQTMVISIAGSDAFSSAWGRQPDFELLEDGGTADGVADMREIFPGSLYGGTGPATLTNSSEIVVLYYWDGVSNLVTDIDMFMWGTSTSARADKTGITINGSTYQADTPIASQDPLTPAHDVGGSYERLDPEEGNEVATGGNGAGGHNETSENLSSTWQPVTAATPGVFGTVDLTFTGATTSATTPDGPVTVTGSLTALVPVSSVTLNYTINGGALQTAACADNGDGTWSGDVPQQTVGTVVTWYLQAAGSGGAEAFWPADAPAATLSYTVEERPDPVLNPPHLLLSEVCVTSNDHEFVEIYNPTTEAVDLSNYYLTDAVHYQQGYWRLPEGNPTQETVGGGAFYDFNARFPAGYMLPPGGVITVAITGSVGFTSVWGQEPDIVLINPDNASIPEMRDVFPGSRRGDPVDNAAVATLTNAGEIVVLYFWDQVSNLVKDIDVFTYGTSTGSARLDRAQYTINGESYAADTPVANQDVFELTHAVGESYQRTDATEGSETRSGGNGTLGHDETSENLTATWEIATSPNPGVFSEYVASFSFAPGQFEAGVPSTFTLVLADGVDDPTSAAFHYAVDGGSFSQVPLTGTNGEWSGSVPAFEAGQEVSWYVSLNYDGTEVYFPAGGEAGANVIEVLAGFSLSVEPRTFLPGFEDFPITITFPMGNEAVVRILDLEGRVVRTLYDTRFETVGAPINRVTLPWDGRNDEFELVKAGTYIVHLQAVDETTGKRENETAPAVVATRLSR